MSGYRTTDRSPWSRTVADGTEILSLRGELDLATALDLECFLQCLRHPGARRVLLDLSGVAFIDCHNVGVIGRAAQAATSAGTVVRVVGLTGLTARVFSICGLGELLEPAPDTREGDR